MGQQRHGQEHAAETAAAALRVVHRLVTARQREPYGLGRPSAEQRHDPLQVPAVRHEPVRQPPRGDGFDDLVEPTVDQRLAAGQTDRDVSPHRQRVVQDAADQGGLQLPHRLDVIPDAMRAPQVAVPRDREAEQHGRTAAPSSRAADAR